MEIYINFQKKEWLIVWFSLEFWKFCWNDLDIRLKQEHMITMALEMLQVYNPERHVLMQYNIV